MINFVSPSGSTSDALAFIQITTVKTQPVKFAFRALTGRKVVIRKPRVSHCPLLFLCKRGRFWIECDSNPHLLTPHNLLITPANARIGIETEENANADLTVLEFTASMSFLNPLMHHGCFFSKSATAIEPLLRRLEESSDCQTVYNDGLLLMILRDLEIQAEEKMRCNQTIAYIRRHIADPPSSVTVGYGVRYSPDHLTKLLQKNLGISLSALIARERIKIIKSYLRLTDYPLERIAVLLAFHSQNHMIKFFKYHTGTTPANYRKKYKSDQII